MRHLQPGEILDQRYEIIRELGSGGSGVVYDAIQCDVGRPLVVKTLLPEITDDPVALARFQREAQVTANLNHPNIITVFDFGVHEGLHYLVMERHDGHTLDRHIKAEAPFESARVKRILAQILDGLVAAHAAGIVHRDLKPGNIFVAQSEARTDHIKIFDFGIAGHVEPEEDHRLTQAGFIVGTPGYVAPELLDETALTERVDLYSAGIIAYEMLTGRRAFPVKGSLEKLHAQKVSDPEPPPFEIQQQPIWRVVRRLFQRDPSARYLDAQMALEDLLSVPVDDVVPPLVPPGLKSSNVEEPTNNLRLASSGELPASVSSSGTRALRTEENPTQSSRTPLILLLALLLAGAAGAGVYFFLQSSDDAASDSSGSVAADERPGSESEAQSDQEPDDERSDEGQNDEGQNDEGQNDEGQNDEGQSDGDPNQGVPADPGSAPSADHEPQDQQANSNVTAVTAPGATADTASDAVSASGSPLSALANSGPGSASAPAIPLPRPEPGEAGAIAELPWRSRPWYPPPVQPVAVEVGPAEAGEPGYGGCGGVDCLVARVDAGSLVRLTASALGLDTLSGASVSVPLPVSMDSDSKHVDVWIPLNTVGVTVDVQTDAEPTRVFLFARQTLARRAIASYQRDDLYDMAAAILEVDRLPLDVQVPRSDFPSLIEQVTLLRKATAPQILVHGMRADAPVSASLLDESAKSGITPFPESAPFLTVEPLRMTDDEVLYGVVESELGCDVENRLRIWQLKSTGTPVEQFALADAPWLAGAPKKWRDAPPEQLFARLGHDGYAMHKVLLFDNPEGCRAQDEPVLAAPLLRPMP